MPAYDFGDIIHFESVTRVLNFGLYDPIGQDDNLYSFLVDAEENEWDVLMNRTTSLKISQYVDNLLYDNGEPYPAPPYSSDASVFFVPEPTMICLLGLGAAVLWRKRRV